MLVSKIYTKTYGCMMGGHSLLFGPLRSNKMNYKLKVSSEKFLHTNIIYQNNIIITDVVNHKSRAHFVRQKHQSCIKLAI